MVCSSALMKVASPSSPMLGHRLSVAVQAARVGPEVDVFVSVGIAVSIDTAAVDISCMGVDRIIRVIAAFTQGGTLVV